MISWPHGAEQYLNCGYVVDHVKIGVEMQTGPEKIVRRQEVERVVRLMMEGPEGKVIRNRVQEFQKKAEAAVADGGSKTRAYQELLGDLREHEHERSSVVERQ